MLTFTPLLIDGTDQYLSRAKIVGGWLVKMNSIVTGGVTYAPVAMGGITFVADPSHTWDGTSLP